MAGLLDLFSGRSSDIYGEGLLTPEQRGGLGNIGLLALAGKLGQLAGPSFSPVPDFGAALGQAAGAYGASQEGAGTAALNAILTGQKGRKLQQELEFGKQLQGSLPELMKLIGGLGSGGGEGSGSTGGAATAPLGAGGGGGGGGPGRMSYDQVLQLVLAKGFPADKAPIMAATIMAESGGNPSAANLNPSDPGGSYGLTQINAGAHGPKAKEALGNPDRAVELAYDISKGGTDFSPWTAYKTGAYRRFLPPGGGAPTAAAAVAPAPAAGGGLLNLPQVPNFARDQLGGGAVPLGVNIGPTSDAAPADVAPNRVGRFVGVAPGTPVNSRGFPYNPEITDPAVAARVAQSMAAIKQAQQSGVPWAAPRETSGGAMPGQGAALEEPPGFAGRQLVAQLGARPPLDDVSQYQQVAGPGGGEPGGGMVSGLLTRGGVPGLPAMPAAAPPSADPRLQLGPLAPAPAAAAPAAAGPGLLSPPGAPAAAALPRGANPAYGNVSNLLGILGVQAEAAGLKNVFAPLADAFRQSPAFQAQLEREKARVGVEFAGPRTTAEKTAAEPFDIRASERALGNALTEKGWRMVNGQAQLIPGYDTVQQAINLSQAAGKGLGELPTNLIIKGVENQNAIRQAAAANGTNVTFGEDGEVTFSPAPGAKEAAAAQAGAVSGAQARAKANVEAGTAPGLARETETQRGFAAQDTSARAQALAAREGLFLLGDARQQLEGAGIFSGALANPKMTLAQYYSSLTGVPNEQLVNTQVFLQQAGARSAAILQAGTYGTGTAIGKTDLDAANRLANGDNTVSLEAIKRVFDLTEKTAHRKIEMFNDMIRKRDPNSVIEPPSRSVSAGTAGALDFSKMSPQDLAAAVTRGDLTMDQRRAIDQRFRELGH